MKKIFIYLASGLALLSLGWLANNLYRRPAKSLPAINQIKPRPLEKYTIENLSNKLIPASKISIGEQIKKAVGFSSYVFSLSFDPTLSGKEAKKITGLINIPDGIGPFPLIVMFRGYVDQKIYQTGMGTQRAGEYFAQNGFIALAPDFLGFGGSDPEAENIFESRFQTYTTAIVLLHSIEEPSFAKASGAKWDGKNVFIWGHSNGGHVAIISLEITGKAYPTVLWAPVSAPFPYSILYYLGEADDGGKLIIQKLSDFFELYDPKLYSPDNYYEKISTGSAILVHQGTADDAVPAVWTETLVKRLKKLNIKTDYFTYPGADHNLQPDWNTVVAQDVLFFKSHIK